MCHKSENLVTFPNFLFLVFYGTKQGKPPKKQGFFSAGTLNKFPGKESGNAPKSKEFLANEKSKEIQNARGKENEGCLHLQPIPSTHPPPPLTPHLPLRESASSLSFLSISSRLPVLSSPHRAMQVCDAIYFCSPRCETRDASLRYDVFLQPAM